MRTHGTSTGVRTYAQTDTTTDNAAQRAQTGGEAFANARHTSNLAELTFDCRTVGPRARVAREEPRLWRNRLSTTSRERGAPPQNSCACNAATTDCARHEQRHAARGGRTLTSTCCPCSSKVTRRTPSTWKDRDSAISVARLTHVDPYANHMRRKDTAASPPVLSAVRNVNGTRQLGDLHDVGMLRRPTRRRAILHTTDNAVGTDSDGRTRWPQSCARRQNLFHERATGQGVQGANAECVEQPRQEIEAVFLRWIIRARQKQTKLCSPRVLHTARGAQRLGQHDVLNANLHAHELSVPRIQQRQHAGQDGADGALIRAASRHPESAFNLPAGRIREGAHTHTPKAKGAHHSHTTPKCTHTYTVPQ